MTVNLNATGSITTTVGSEGSGVRLGTGGVTIAAGATITINNSATTNGRSDGINIDTVYNIVSRTPTSITFNTTLTNAGTITLVGTGGPGLDGTNTNTADGITVGLGDVTNSGTIITNDVNSAGIVFRGDGTPVSGFNPDGTITNSGTVITNGNGSPGLIHNNTNTFGTTTSTAIINSGSVTTNGGLANGIASDGILFGIGNGDSVINTGTITINGPSGSGIRIVGGGGDTATNILGGTIVINLNAVNPAGAVSAPLSGMTGISTSTGDIFTNGGLIYVGDQTLALANADPNAGGSIAGNRFTTAAPVTALAAPGAGSAALLAASHGISLLGTGDTVSNSGTIHMNTVGGGSHGINAVGGSTISNTGTIVTQIGAAGAGSHGINVTGNDSVTNAAGGTIDTYGAASHGINATSNATISNAGTIVTNFAGSNGINSTGSAAISNSGTITTTAAGSFGINSTGSGSINHSGTITTAGAGDFGINSTGGAAVTNTGTINTGNFAATHGINISAGSAGSAVANSGNTITVNGAGSHGINFTGGATAGGISNGSNITINGAGTGINMDGSDTVINSGNITLATAAGLHGITLTGGGNRLTNSGNIVFTVANAQDGINATGGAGDTISNSGTITIAAGGTGSAINAGAGDQVTNSGTLTMAATGSHAISIAAGTGSVTNGPGGVITLAAGNANNGINSGGGGNALTNAGTITINGTGNGLVTAGGGDSASNSGTININAGAGNAITGAAGDTFANTGTINMGAVTTGAAINILGGTTLSGSGTITMNNAASAADAISAAGNNNNISTGSITMAGTGSAINTTGANNTINASGTISMNNAGSGAHAVALTGGGNTVTTGTITMLGNGNAVNSTAGGNTITSTGAITLTGGTALNLSGATVDTATNSGTITIDGAGEIAVNFNGVGHTFTNSGTISDVVNASILTGAGGNITNSGTLTDAGGGAVGITTAGATVTNSGSIALSGAGAGINITGATPSLTNTGTINTLGFGITDNTGATINHSGSITTSGAGSHGINLLGAAANTINITGTIAAAGVGSNAIFSNNTARTININATTLNSGSAQVIQLGNANDTVNVQGRVNISGIIDGGGLGADVDTLNISNMRLGQALIDQLLAAAASPAGTAQLFGSTLSWNDFETINVDTSTIVSYSSLLTSPEVSSFGAALDSINTFNDADLLLFLNAFDTIPAAQLESTVLHVIGQDTLQGISTVGISTATQFTNAFMSRLPTFIGSGAELNGSNFTLLDASLDPLLASTSQYLAYNSPGMAVSDTASMGLATTAASTATGRLSYQELYPQATVSDEPANRFSAELIGSGTMANQEATNDRPKSDYFVTSATLRGAYHINKEATVGLYGGYNGGAAETDAFGSELDYQGGHAGLFAQYRYNNMRFTALTGYTYTNYESNRKIVMPGINRLANSETDSHQLLAAGEFAYDFILGPHKQWRISPILGVQYTHMMIDGYSETGAGALSLTIGDQTVDSLQTKVGLELSKIWQYSEANHITFFANGFWHHEVLDNSRTVNAAFNSTAINSFTVNTENPERDFANVGVGLDAVPFTNMDVHLLLGYQNQFGQDGYMSHTLYGGYRQNF